MPLTHCATAAVAILVVSQLSQPNGGAIAGATGLAQSKDTIYHRVADITLTIANSRRYAGTYTASGVSRVCGNAMFNMTGFKDGFDFEFPFDGTYEIHDVNFSADTLKAGVISSSYYIDLNLRTKDGGRPPGWVLRTNQPKYGETGTVLLTVNGSVATLKITGQNNEGETLDMTVVCKAKVP